MFKAACITALVFTVASCNFFKPDAEPEAVARVNDSYLYRDEISDIVPKGIGREDSLIIINNYIDRWATRKLLIDAAEINLNQEAQEQLDNLINQYKIDLYTKAYIEEIVKRSVDTVVTQQELSGYYKANKENFKTNATLVRLRYIHLARSNPKFENIRRKFLDFRKSDAAFWETNVLQFRNYALNDSVWAEMGQVYARLPFITPENRDRYIIPGKAFQFDDDSLTYFVKITNVLDKNRTAPLEYIKPTLKEVILNNRKLELIKKFEKEITDDAIKNRKYEIYK
ncbi:MAG: hypothetical protein ITG00_08035 [Flavobacterium sp.]|nr:hypothetical protein [Flavobacterium sp.]